ncbi:phasin family protein [Bradyrhizobium sp.]|uniref:phasin family protein n=1 Tax=Bradyrhizobium sp. TaxID=376 RepID=UPI004037A86B
MSKLRSKPISSGARRARRSLVELTAAAVSSAVQDDLLETPAASPAASPEKISPVEEVGGAARHLAGSPLADDRSVAGEAPAAVRVSIPEAASNAGKFQDSGRNDATTEMAVRIAKDYQASVLDSMKASMNAALDYAKGLANSRTPTDAASMTAQREEENNSPALDAATEYRTEAFDLMKTNMSATLEYAHQLISTKSSAEFIELSSTQARKQFELILKQASALRSFAETMTMNHERTPHEHDDEA